MGTSVRFETFITGPPYNTICIFQINNPSWKYPEAEVEDFEAELQLTPG